MKQVNRLAGITQPLTDGTCGANARQRVDWCPWAAASQAFGIARGEPRTGADPLRDLSYALRSSLTGILGLAELLVDDPTVRDALPPHRHGDLERILSEANSLLQVCERLVDCRGAEIPAHEAFHDTFAETHSVHAQAPRILVTEDNDATQRILRIRLQQWGNRVDVASHGLEALDRIQAATTCGDPYDLILMDMQMPMLDGYETTRRLRAIGITSPIIAVTADVMAEDRGECMRIGCNDHVRKPVDWQHLRRVIGEALGLAVP